MSGQFWFGVVIGMCLQTALFIVLAVGMQFFDYLQQRRRERLPAPKIVLH